VLALASASLLAFGGCDVSEDADVERGRALFLAKCGTCHELAQAGSGQGVGPNLDAAFAQARADGMDNDTVEGVVEKQIAHPRLPRVPEGTPEYTQTYMPEELVTGQDSEDVSTYVATVAGVPGAKPPALGDATQIFTEKCGGCHTLEPGAPPGTGPNLADSLQGKDAAYIREQIVDPNSQIFDGFAADIMPQDFEAQLPADKLKELVDYLLEQARG
jgi:mono/diheme cytochrome c family protein